MKKYLFITIAGIVFLACKKHHLAPNSGYDPGKPSFRAGTKWIYHYTSYLPDGSVASEDDISFQISKDTTINGAKYFATTNNYYFANKSTGYYEFDKNLSLENLIYKNPASNPDAYSGQYLSFPPSTCISGFNAQVKNIDTVKTMNGKTYDKLIYYSFSNYSSNCQYLPTYSYDLFSTKIGLKLSQSFYSNNNLSEKIDLASFTY